VRRIRGWRRWCLLGREVKERIRREERERRTHEEDEEAAQDTDDDESDHVTECRCERSSDVVYGGVIRSVPTVEKGGRKEEERTRIYSEAPTEDDEGAHEAPQYARAETRRQHAHAQHQQSLKVSTPQRRRLVRPSVQRMLQRMMYSLPRRHSERKRQQSRDEGDDERLNLQQRQIAEYE
jgi:hypothetical protein